MKENERRENWLPEGLGFRASVLFGILRRSKIDLQSRRTLAIEYIPISPHLETKQIMAKPHRKLKKANHGKRPANAKARKAKRKKLRT